MSETMAKIVKTEMVLVTNDCGDVELDLKKELVDEQDPLKEMSFFNAKGNSKCKRISSIHL